MTMAKRFRVIFVHGFGGLSNRPPFVDEFDTFSLKFGRRVRIDTEAWNSQEITSDPGVRFEKAIQESLKASEVLREKIQNMESVGTPYYLISHSLGCRVVLGAIEGLQNESISCRGIFCLGAADDAARRLSTRFVPRGARIINYFSPRHDKILHDLYYNKLGHVAAGTSGFRCDKFVNYRCSATHTRKGVVFHADWSSMAPALAEIIFENEGVPLNDRLGLNLRMKVANAGNWWNNLIEMDGVNIFGNICDVEVQQHRLKGHYRLLTAKPGADRWYREGHSDRLSPLLSRILMAKRNPRPE